MALTTSWGRVSVGTCPVSGNSTRVASGIRAARSRAAAGGTMASCSPWMTKVGASIFSAGGGDVLLGVGFEYAGRCLAVSPQQDLPTPPTDVLAVRFRHTGIDEPLHSGREIRAGTVDERLRSTRCRRSVDEYEACDPIGVLDRYGHAGQCAHGFAGEHAAVDLEMIEDTNQIGDEGLGTDLLGGGGGRAGTTMVVGHTAPLSLHDLEGFLPELPAPDPAAVSNKRRAIRRPPADDIEQHAVPLDEHE